MRELRECYGLSLESLVFTGTFIPSVKYHALYFSVCLIRSAYKAILSDGAITRAIFLASDSLTLNAQ